MKVYTHCKFCNSELTELKNSRTAYCDRECKRLANKYGTVKNMIIDKPLPPPVNRKTNRTQTKRVPSQLRYNGHIFTNDGRQWIQLELTILYPEEIAPHALTGGAIAYDNEE